VNKFKKLLISFILFMFFVYLWLILGRSSCTQVFAPIENRELGVLEIAQTLILLVTVYIGLDQILKSIRTKDWAVFFWGVFTSVLLFVLLEEIDYGLHYYDYLLGNEPYHSNINGTFRNIHNQGNNNVIIKTIILILQISILGFVPFFNLSIGNKIFDKKYAICFWVITLITPILSLTLSRYLPLIEVEKLRESQLLAEMRELGYYFILWVFIKEYRVELRNTRFFIKAGVER